MKAVVSGATKGIGKAIAEKLAAQGFDLLLIARNKDELNRCMAELSNPKIVIDVLAIDLSQNNITELLENNSPLFKNTSLLINNLGVYSTQNATEIDLTLLKQQMNVNLYSAIALTQTILKQDKKNQLHNIINIASVMSLRATSFAADYSMSKHAFKAWNDALREELRDKGKKVSAIYPGSVNTSSWDGLDVNRAEMIQAEDIAEMVGCVLAMKGNTLLEEIHVSPVNFKP